MAQAPPGVPTRRCHPRDTCGPYRPLRGCQTDWGAEFAESARTKLLGCASPFRFLREINVSDFSRRIQQAGLRLQRATDCELADMRQHYFPLTEDERKTFRVQLQIIAQAAEALGHGAFGVMIHLNAHWSCAADGESITIKAARTPQEVLAAIVEWDSADQDDQTPGSF